MNQLEADLAAIEVRCQQISRDSGPWAVLHRKYLSKQRRAARMLAARLKGTHTDEEWNQILERHGHRCAGCGIDATALTGGSLTKDHIVAVSKGGSDGADNLQPMCRNCNSAKG